ncbi:hypothetical protein HNY73_015582 [Argiope bruennichi]|uniref:Uncharacterized protein n=1 Tax=Argiope bruennichi TaxID=94029 RepID=A0A8T0EU31_ARGBR|nr:hypothetical protein HNY73_015582 [Argiope bruennichi]
MVEGGEADQKFSAGASSAPSNIAPVPVLTYQLVFSLETTRKTLTGRGYGASSTNYRSRRDKTTPQRFGSNQLQQGVNHQQTTPQRRTDLWRTDNNVLFCYHCVRPRHVLRYCRERRRIFQNARATRTINPRRDVYADSLASFDDDYAQPTSSRIRSSSLYPRRSLNRRELQSPARRSSRSPRRLAEDLYRRHGLGRPVQEEADGAMIVGSTSLRYEKELSIPASIVDIENGYCKVWITNCSRRTQLIPKGMNIGCLTTIANDAICSLSDKDRECSQGHKSRKRAHEKEEKFSILIYKY